MGENVRDSNSCLWVLRLLVRASGRVRQPTVDLAVRAAARRRRRRKRRRWRRVGCDVRRQRPHHHRLRRIDPPRPRVPGFRPRSCRLLQERPLLFDDGSRRRRIRHFSGRIFGHRIAEARLAGPDWSDGRQIRQTGRHFERVFRFVLVDREGHRRSGFSDSSCRARACRDRPGESLDRKSSRQRNRKWRHRLQLSRFDWIHIQLLRLLLLLMDQVLPDHWWVWSSRLLGRGQGCHRGSWRRPFYVWPWSGRGHGDSGRWLFPDNCGRICDDFLSRNLLQLLSHAVEVGLVEALRRDGSLLQVVVVVVGTFHVRLQKLRHLSESRLSERQVLSEIFQGVWPALVVVVDVGVVADAGRRIDRVDARCRRWSAVGLLLLVPVSWVVCSVRHSRWVLNGIASSVVFFDVWVLIPVTSVFVCVKVLAEKLTKIRFALLRSVE